VIYHKKKKNLERASDERKWPAGESNGRNHLWQESSREILHANIESCPDRDTSCAKPAN